MKNVRSSQPCISMNFCTNSVKHKFFPVSIVNPREYQWKCQQAKLSVLKDNFNKNHNSWENKWNVSPASGIFIRTLIWGTSLEFSF